MLALLLPVAPETAMVSKSNHGGGGRGRVQTPKDAGAETLELELGVNSDSARLPLGPWTSH